MNFGTENEFVEFKKSTSEIKEAIIDITAILNKHGKGTIYFGVKNNGEVCGMNVSESTTRDISRKIYEQIKPQIYPTIEVINVLDKNIIKVSFNGTQKPYSADGRYYKRVADESREINPLELVKMIMSENYANWENLQSDVTVDDIDEKQLKIFYTKSLKIGKIPDFKYDKVELLSKLNLISNDGFHLNNAGKYLFSNKSPIVVKLAVFATDEKKTFIDINPIRGNIFELIDECEKYVKKHINWEAKIVGFERIEIPEIPLEALREIIINSFAHASYIDNSKHEIDIHPSKVAIYNPGSFPEGYIPEDFVNSNLSSKVRNELICDVLFKCNAIESWGTGLRKTYILCENNKIEVFYEKEYDGFWFFFKRKNQMLENELMVNNYVIKDTIKLTELEKLVLNEIQKDPYVTRESLSITTLRNSRTIQRILDNLKGRKVVYRIGSNKKGCWKINEDIFLKENGSM